jgi:hypothetical protein
MSDAGGMANQGYVEHRTRPRKTREDGPPNFRVRNGKAKAGPDGAGTIKSYF